MIEIAVKGEAEIAKMQPGDVLLVKFDGPISYDVYRSASDALCKGLPEGVRFLIQTSDAEFAILRPVEPASGQIRLLEVDAGLTPYAPPPPSPVPFWLQWEFRRWSIFKARRLWQELELRVRYMEGRLTPLERWAKGEPVIKQDYSHGKPGQSRP